MLRSYKYRLYPSKAQEAQLNEQFNCNRLVYNLALTVKIEAWKKSNKNVTTYELINQIPDLKNGFTWLKNVSSSSLQQSLMDLEKAYSMFFKQNGSFPKFKSKISKKSARYIHNTSVDFTKGTLTVSKVGPIKCIFDRRFSGKLKYATITKTATQKYYASILIETGADIPPKPPVTINKTLGIDLGLSHFITISNGIKIENPRYFKNNSQRLAVLQARLSKKRKGSKNRLKAILKVASLHEKIANRRKDFIHKLSFKLINDNQVDSYSMESLRVVNMMKNRSLSKSIGDAAWAEFLSVMKYKCDWYGKNLLSVGVFYPSSKTCSNCNTINETLLISDRTWDCPACGSHHDRDINAAINIKHAGVERSGETVELFSKKRKLRSSKQSR